MKRIVRTAVLASLVLLLPAFAYAGSSVWKISGNGRHIYIGGTIHVLGESDYPLPDEFERAYSKAQRVILETDFSDMQSPEFQLTLIQALSYPEGESLKQKLSADTYRLLKEYLDKHDIPVAGLTGYKPGMILTTLLMIELQRLGVDGSGVDQYFYSRALENKKALGQLETIEEQLSFMANMGAGNEDSFVAYVLDDLEDLPGLFKMIRQAWRSGDTEFFTREVLAPWKKEFPDIYNELVVKRNNAWIPQIEAMLKTGDVELVLVGTAHLAGQDGLLKKLAARGYRVEQL